MITLLMCAANVYVRNCCVSDSTTGTKRENRNSIAGRHRRKSITQTGETCGQIEHVAGHRDSGADSGADKPDREYFIRRIPHEARAEGNEQQEQVTQDPAPQNFRLSQTVPCTRRAHAPTAMLYNTLLNPTITGWLLSPRDGRDEACRVDETSFRREPHSRSVRCWVWQTAVMPRASKNGKKGAFVLSGTKMGGSRDPRHPKSGDRKRSEIPHNQHLVSVSFCSGPSDPLCLKSPPLKRQIPMKKTGYIILCCAVGAGAFIAPPALRAPRPSALQLPAVGGGADQVTVFDAGETPVSWDDYKKQKPNEYKVRVWRSCVAVEATCTPC